MLGLHYEKRVQMMSFFWSIFSRIRTEYIALLSKSPYSLRTRENTDQEKVLIWALFTQYWISIFNPNTGKCGPKNSAFGHLLRSDSCPHCRELALNFTNHQ